MKEIGQGFKKIFKEEKGLLILMGVLIVVGLVLVFHTLFHFKAGTTTMYIGYSDIGKFSGGDWLSLWNSGGYRTGGWGDIIVFPILGGVLSILHNFLAIQIFNRRGKGYAQIFLLVSISVGVSAFVLLLRLLGEI